MAVDLSVSYRAPATARAMSEAAIKFLDSLNPAQRKAATFPFAGNAPPFPNASAPVTFMPYATTE